jgi:SAM-dependent methyltransferase
MTAYTQSARVYDALFRQKDYRRAVRSLLRVVRTFAPAAKSLLDVGCGTGRHLELLRHHFRVEGLDLSREMLAIARRRCPGVRLHRGTLVDFSLGRRFDVITCLFGSIGYAKTVRNLGTAVQCMARHLSPDGVLIVEPWIAPERFVSGRLVFDRVDEPDLKVGRMYVTKRRGAVSVFDSHYIVATPAGVTHFTERQELGLFTGRQYRQAFRAAGLEVVATTPDLLGYGLYVCRFAGSVTRTGTSRRRSS